MKQRRLDGWRRLALTPLLLLMVPLLVLTASLMRPGIAHAQSGDTITLASTAKLIARTSVQISGTTTCSIPAGATLIEAGGDVTITQASGQVIVSAFGFISSPVICDGTARTFQATVTPPAGSAPYHGGPAVAFGDVLVDYIDASGAFIETGGSAGPQTITIQG
jgi:hypothetical protein